jgi:diaminohydroxyphosphoribosylaminopyrimidine deaminase/5-amino-6-(5-phosphoribosylamino)uracil reductase
MVGCVIVKARQVLGEGYHRRFGGPHAEIEALRACPRDPRGATVYVSLEPCCSHGKTPPCVDALSDAGIARVVVGLTDPSPAVNGRGIKRLRDAGIKVEANVLPDQAAELIAPFLTRVCLGRPYVIAKWAQSLDGKLATRMGHSQWISSDASRRRVHRLRARVDAILVGVGTAKIDDPMLTAREVPIRRRALRVVLDGRLRIPERCRLVHTASEIPTLLFTGASKVGTSKAERLQNQGVEILPCRLHRRRLSLAMCLRELAKREVTNVLVEGGPTVLTSFFEAGLVDEAHVFTAPKLIGGESAPSAWAGRGAIRVNAAATPRVVRIQRCGPDIIHHLRFTDPRQLV